MEGFPEGGRGGNRSRPANRTGRRCTGYADRTRSCRLVDSIPT
jgi:hypothetical protein